MVAHRNGRSLWGARLPAFPALLVVRYGAIILEWSIETRIRPATSSDAPFIGKCNMSLALETEHKRLPLARVRAGVKALLRDPAKGTYFLAETDGIPVGQLLITYEWSDWRNGNFGGFRACTWRNNSAIAEFFGHY